MLWYLAAFTLGLFSPKIYSFSRKKIRKRLGLSDDDDPKERKVLLG